MSQAMKIHPNQESIHLIFRIHSINNQIDECQKLEWILFFLVELVFSVQITISFDKLGAYVCVNVWSKCVERS